MGMNKKTGAGRGSGSSDNKTLSLSYMEWDEDVANSHVIKLLAGELSAIRVWGRSSATWGWYSRA